MWLLMEINDTQLNISAVHLSFSLPLSLPLPAFFFLFLSVFDNILRGFALQGGAQGEDHALKPFSQRKDKLCISCDISRGLRPFSIQPVRWTSVSNGGICSVTTPPPLRSGLTVFFLSTYTVTDLSCFWQGQCLLLDTGVVLDGSTSVSVWETDNSQAN
ncbi:hypothetical protein BDV24DRAFT_40210 [Aspergillus arachidicola]|uniref:Uncharacterized protein n=1 Tax=Aspergillus arachidicola TaxID=656916 RepID=A0A5N6YBU0_9EURO|nr:hypothetical protein BDV24DRAFT_40210 [Aspergillus arachidicola]